MSRLSIVFQIIYQLEKVLFILLLILLLSACVNIYS